MVTAVHKNRLDSIVRTCRMLGRINRSRKADVIYYQLLGEYYERLSKANQNGDFVIAHTIFLPAELFYAIGIVPMHAEMTAWMIALFTGDVMDLLAAAGERGYASEICSAHRLLAGGLELDVLPKPNAVVWTNLVCEGSFKSGIHIKEKHGVPAYLMESPFKHSEREDRYFNEEVRGMVSFIEEQTGRKLDRKKLAETMAVVDRQIELYREIDDLRKAIPSPLPPQDFLKLMTVDCLFPGLPLAVQYLETLRDEMAEMVKQGKGVLEQERFRILNFTMPPLRLMAAIDRISREHGAIAVADPFLIGWGPGHLDAPDPLDNLVKKVNMLPPMCMWGPLDNRAREHVQSAALSHKVHGAIFYSQMGCGQTGGTIRFYKDVLAEIDVPMLTMNIDIVDTTVATEEDVRKQLEQFYEFLADR